MQKNEIYEIEITSMSSEGSGIGRVDEMVVFVPNTAIGDRTRIKIVKVLKNYAFGKLEEIIVPSRDRIINNCPAFEKCGGCAYRHISYDSELSLKSEQVFHNITAIGKTNFDKCNPLFDINTERYRNKGQFPVGKNEKGKIITGFFAPRSHRIIPISDCLLQPKIFSEIVSVCTDFFEEKNISVYDENTKKGLIRHIYLRQCEITHEIMVCFVVNGKNFTDVDVLCERLSTMFPQIKSIILNINRNDNNVILGDKCITLWGCDTITDVMCGLKVSISPLSFYQVNHTMAQKVYELAGKLADFKGNETLLDLYCGAGLIGLSVAKKVEKLVGIEIINDAILNAKQNAKDNNIDNAEFYCGDASLVADLLDKGYSFDVAFVDPPRKGCSSDVIEALAICGAKKIVMISCNSATLARDINSLKEKGYIVKKVVPADLFPRTIHCETVALLERC